MDHRLEVTASGVKLTKENDKHTAWSAEWSDVCQIIAFKRDLFTFDRVYLGICTETDSDKEERDQWYHLCHEELRGWPTLMDAIRSRYGLTAIERVHSIVLPPFEETSVVVWQRDLESEQEHSRS